MPGRSISLTRVAVTTLEAEVASVWLVEVCVAGVPGLPATPASGLPADRTLYGLNTVRITGNLALFTLLFVKFLKKVKYNPVKDICSR